MASSSAAGTERKKWKVLLVEGNPIVKTYCARLLTTHKFEVATECNGYRALEYIEDHKELKEVDLILTDHDMHEDMSGFDLLCTVKKSTTRNKVHVAIMSAGVVPSRIERCIAKGALRYYIKPLKDENIWELRKLIEESGALNG